MSAFARPGVFAAVLSGAALALHPATGAARWLPGQPAVLAALLLLAVLALAARAAGARERRLAAVAMATGAAVLVGALGVDGLRGHHGGLTLATGQSRGNFDEEDSRGRSLGLRPLGFAVGAERVTEDGVASRLLGPQRAGRADARARGRVRRLPLRTAPRHDHRRGRAAARRGLRRRPHARRGRSTRRPGPRR